MTDPGPNILEIRLRKATARPLIWSKWHDGFVGGQQSAADQGLRAQSTRFSIEAAFSEAIRTARQEKSVPLLKRAEAGHR